MTEANDPINPWLRRKTMSQETCQRCGENDYDRRTLWMACFYKMSELDLPFREITMFGHRKLEINEHIESTPIESSEHLYYTLRVCKDCRADWMQAIKKWFDEKFTTPKTGCGSGIFIRRNGSLVEVTEAVTITLVP